MIKQVLYISNFANWLKDHEYIISITCNVSKNNIIKGEYTIISEGQNIFIELGNSIRFIVDDSFGVMVLKLVSDTFDNTRKSISFLINYYDSLIKKGKEFPYKIYLLGKKLFFNKLRNLEETYDYNISLSNCIVFNYLDEDKSNIGNITCDLPNYIPAGNYSKIHSEGFDVNPNIKLNIVFKNDYKANILDENSSSKKKSSSKAWIIWLCIVLAILIGAGIIIIIICIIRKKRNIENTHEIKIENNKDIN